MVKTIEEVKKDLRQGLIKYMEKKNPGKSLSTYKTYASDSNYLINNNHGKEYIEFMRSPENDPKIIQLIRDILVEHRGEAKVKDEGKYYYEKLCWQKEYVDSLGGINKLLGTKNKKNKEKFSSWHVGVAAEAIAAAQFARCGVAVSVQYGANQPEYDLVVVDADKMMKISVKGSKDGGWGLTQSYKKGRDYHEAINEWLKNHGKKTVFCLVQFQGIELGEMPRVYLASPAEIAEELHNARAGHGETILREYWEWTKSGVASGTVDKIPESWIFSEKRVHELLDKCI